MKYSVIDNYDNLPAELRKELTTLDDVDIKILKLLKSEGLLNIDNILIGLYLEHKMISTHDTIEQVIKKLTRLGELKSQRGQYFIQKKTVKKASEKRSEKVGEIAS